MHVHFTFRRLVGLLKGGVTGSAVWLAWRENGEPLAQNSNRLVADVGQLISYTDTVQNTVKPKKI